MRILIQIKRGKYWKKPEIEDIIDLYYHLTGIIVREDIIL